MKNTSFMNPEACVQLVQSGQRVYFGHGCAEPQTLVGALLKRTNLSAVEIVHLLGLGASPYSSPNASLEMQKAFHHNSLFLGPHTRDGIKKGITDFTPIFLSEIPKLFKEGILPLDVAFVQITPPDKNGWCSLGISVDVTKPAADNCKVLIGQINSYMPRTHGDTFLHISQFDAVCEVHEPIMTYMPTKTGEVHQKIAANINPLIPDGATLQLGIGVIPDAVLNSLSNKNDLGIHTEMFSDGVMNLVRSGNISNNHKKLHRGKLVTSFLMGSQSLYDFVNDNPSLEMRHSGYVNDPFIIAQNNNMISINSALEIDLTGQVVADSLGYLPFSGIGGQVDFVRGAKRSYGGKAIIALPSTAQKGQVSRIVCKLTEGSAVTTSRGDVDWIVTENGAVNLWGKTLKQRIELLISIAHPDHKENLRLQAKGVYPWF